MCNSRCAGTTAMHRLKFTSAKLKENHQPPPFLPRTVASFNKIYQTLKWVFGRKQWNFICYRIVSLDKNTSFFIPYTPPYSPSTGASMHNNTTDITFIHYSIHHSNTTARHVHVQCSLCTIWCAVMCTEFHRIHQFHDASA